MRRALATPLAALWLTALALGDAVAADVPVAGRTLVLRDGTRGAVVRLRDAAIAAPFGDPRAGGARLVVHGGAAPGQCAVDVPLDAAGWAPLAGDGAARGWRWRDPSGRRAGVRRVVVRPGRIDVRVRGPLWPCDVAAAQRLPVTVTVRTGATRWCAAFGGTIVDPGPGRFRADAAPAPPACPASGVGIASLNVLHGLACPAPTDRCRYADRVALVRQWVAARGCPDVVAFQEVLEAQVPILTAELDGLCGGYDVVYTPANRVDDAMLWTRVPVVDAAVVPLHRGFRNVLVARLDHPAGPLDVLVTHLASGADGAGQPCGADCPAACGAAGAATVRECQAVQVAALAADPTRGLTLVTGDFNAEPDGFVYDTLTAHGWADSQRAAGLPECMPATGAGCTGGRADDVLDELESPASNERSRIDYVVLAQAPDGPCRIEAAGDPDGDGIATRLFADEPNPFAPSCGPAPAPICWPSDHVGVQADVECR